MISVEFKTTQLSWRGLGDVACHSPVCSVACGELDSEESRSRHAKRTVVRLGWRLGVTILKVAGQRQRPSETTTLLMQVGGHLSLRILQPQTPFLPPVESVGPFQGEERKADRPLIHFRPSQLLFEFGSLRVGDMSIVNRKEEKRKAPKEASDRLPTISTANVTSKSSVCCKGPIILSHTRAPVCLDSPKPNYRPPSHLGCVVRMLQVCRAPTKCALRDLQKVGA